MSHFLYALMFLIPLIVYSARISNPAAAVLSNHKSPATHVSVFPKSLNLLEKKGSEVSCFADRGYETPAIINVGQVIKHRLPGVGKHIEISHYDIKSHATLLNKLQFKNNGKWNTIWDAIDFGEAPFLPMKFPTQDMPGSWRWELTCIANCRNAKVHAVNTDYCFHNTTIRRTSQQRPEVRSLIGGSSILGCHRMQVPYPISMTHVGAEHIFPLDGQGREIRIIEYNLFVNSTVEHKLQFWNNGWRTIWSSTSFGDAPSSPSYVAAQKKKGPWRWTLTCVSQCNSELRGLRTEYCLQPIS